MRAPAALAAAFLLAVSGDTAHARGKCTPLSQGTCYACTKCSACGNCAKAGGSCSVCKPPKKR